MDFFFADFTAEEVVDLFGREAKRFVYTTTVGPIDKVKLSYVCDELLYKNIPLEYNVWTYLQIFDHFEKFNRDDELIDEKTSLTVFPARIQVIKSLLSHPNQMELDIIIGNNNHKALRIMIKAEDSDVEHEVVPFSSTDPLPCACQRPLSGMNVNICTKCKTVVCEICRKNPCHIVLQELISAADEEKPKKDEVEDESSADEMEECDSDAESDVEMNWDEDWNEEEMEFECYEEGFNYVLV